jgi:hypothetical protein
MSQPTTDNFNHWEKAKKGAKTKSKRGKVRSHRIERADNGFISHTSYDPADQKGMDRMSMMDDSALHVTKVHKTPEEMGSHASQIMGGKALAPENEAGEPDDSPAEEAAEKKAGKK